MITKPLFLNLLLLFLFAFYFSQSKVPPINENVALFVEINGANINDKVDWNQFNNYYWMKEMYEESYFENWDDFKATGIDYSKKQYHYLEENDSIIAYCIVMPINDEMKLNKFIQKNKFINRSIENKGSYQLLTLDKGSIMAWDSENLFLLIAENKHKWSNNQDREIIYSDTAVAAAVGDAAEVVGEAVRSYPPSDVEMYENMEELEEKSEFDANMSNLNWELEERANELEYYKDELELLEENTEYYKNLILHTEEEIAELEDAKQYLEEHGKMPYIPENRDAWESPLGIANEGYYEDIEVINDTIEIHDGEVYAAPPAVEFHEDADNDTPLDIYNDYNTYEDYEDIVEPYPTYSLFYSEKDSLNFLKKMNYAVKKFDEFFNSSKKSTLPSYIIKYQDKSSDAYLWANPAYSATLNGDDLYKELLPFGVNELRSLYYNLKEKSNADYYLNLYFQKDDVVADISQYYRNKDIRESVKNVYKQKFDKRLLCLLDDKNIVNWSTKFSTEAYLNYLYEIAKFRNVEESRDTISNKELFVSQSMELAIESLKLLIDEKAIADLANGNFAIALHSLEEKEVTYTDYVYDEDYNYEEVERTKMVIAPDFSLAFTTNNEDYWKKVMKLTANAALNEGQKMEFENDIYSFDFRDEEISELYLTVKNGVVLMTSSWEGIDRLLGKKKVKSHSSFIKKLKKNSFHMDLNARDFVNQISNHMNKDGVLKSNEWLKFLNGIMGDFELNSNIEGDLLKTKITYKTYGDYTNSIMYLFDIIEQAYKIDNNISDVEAVY